MEMAQTPTGRRAVKEVWSVCAVGYYSHILLDVTEPNQALKQFREAVAGQTSSGNSAKSCCSCCPALQPCPVPPHPLPCCSPLP